MRRAEPGSLCPDVPRIAHLPSSAWATHACPKKRGVLFLILAGATLSSFSNWLFFLRYANHNKKPSGNIWNHLANRGVNPVPLLIWAGVLSGER